VDNVALDDEIGVSEIVGLARRFADFDPERLQTHSLPVTPYETDGGAAVVLLDAAAAEPVLDVFRGVEAPAVTTTTQPPPDPADVVVDVYNGGQVQGEARRVSYVLADGGFTPGAVETATRPARTTVITYPSGGKALAELVAGWLGPEPELRRDPDVPAGHVVLTLGEDFERIAEPDAAGTTGGGSSSSAGADGAGNGGGGDGEAATATVAPTTTSTTVPGWQPGSPPPGVRCS
jgi:hypothetical protein